MANNFTIDLSEVSITDVAEVGGKNASLGEMIQNLSSKGIPVPGGFAITATAYRYFLESTNLKKTIAEKLQSLNIKDLTSLSETGFSIRREVISAQFPKDLEKAILAAYKKAVQKFGSYSSFAVRSSATAEDLPDASFAGEHETYLNIKGEAKLLESVKKAFASLFTNRAISYRIDKGFDHFKVALSVGVQKMIRSDKATSGVMFSLDTETGFKNVVVINASHGLGEMIVQGKVTPDEYLVFKPTLNKSKHQGLKRVLLKTKYSPIIDKQLGTKSTKMVYNNDSDHPTKIVEVPMSQRNSFCLKDSEILLLASWACIIEDHYSHKHSRWTPMDMEWAKDGPSGKLYIVQARPETVHATKDFSVIKEYSRLQNGKVLTKGASVGSKISSGKAKVIKDISGIKSFKQGEILVTDLTDPDWEPIMKISSGIVTNKGGRTSHAAIVSRELGLPCVVGCENATEVIASGDSITLDTTGSEGLVFEGLLKYKVIEHKITDFPKTKTKVMVNIATPDSAFEKSFLPNSGVGLAREEFIIASNIGIHPLALIHFDTLPSQSQEQINKKTVGYSSKLNYYIDKLSYGIGRICAAFYPKPVIVRLSDFKTNEYRGLLGGESFEPQEENPMLGWRGASRYVDPLFSDAFELEIKAFKKVYEQYGLTNLRILVPFCRTPEEGKEVVALIDKFGLSRKRHDDLHIYCMCEIPSNVLLAKEFLKIFDGMSIGSNDLTQLTLGLDRDGNEKIRHIANENNPALKDLVAQVVKVARQENKYIGICGQAPSDYPEFAKFLVQIGIDSISLNPDTLIKTTKLIYDEEKKL